MPRSDEDFSIDSDDSGADDRSRSDDDSQYSGSDGEYSGGSSNGSYSDDDHDDEYDDDYERGENSGRPKYVVSERFADDDEKKDDGYWWEGREKLIAYILFFWCCLCLVIIAVVLGVVFGTKNKNKNVETEVLPAPTLRPTFAPQPLAPSQFTPSPTESQQPTLAITLSPTIRPSARPTTSPTLSFEPTKGIPNVLGIIADQDTYTQYNISKEFQGEEYGLMDTFLVQKVPLKDEELADSIGLISFPLTDVPGLHRLENRSKSAVLRLHHVVSTEERGPANYTIVRIPETRTKMEFWHGFYFEPPEDDEIGVKVGETFPVDPLDTVVDIDVTSLFYNYTLVDKKRPKKVFFMIENRGPDQVQGGDRFYARESDTPPLLLLNFVGNDTAVLPGDNSTTVEPDNETRKYFRTRDRKE